MSEAVAQLRRLEAANLTGPNTRRALPLTPVPWHLRTFPTAPLSPNSFKPSRCGLQRARPTPARPVPVRGGRVKARPRGVTAPSARTRPVTRSSVTRPRSASPGSVSSAQRRKRANVTRAPTMEKVAVSAPRSRRPRPLPTPPLIATPTRGALLL